MRRGVYYSVIGLMVVFLTTFVSMAGEAFPDRAFQLRFGRAGIASLRCGGDSFETDYIMEGETLGHVLVRYRIGDRSWQEINTPMMAEDGRMRTTPPIMVPQEYCITYDFASRYGWGEDVVMSERFRVEGDSLVWTLHFKNLTDEPIEIGDIALPLPFNTNKGWDRVETETKRLMRHSFISGHGSFIFWMRPNSVGPYLVMIPLAESPSFEPAGSFKPAKLEYFEGRRGPGYQVFVHSAVSGAMAKERGGNWRQEHTSIILSPKFEPGDEVVYGFKFRWADGYEGVRDVLYKEGLFDVHVVPGMTVPEDLEAMIALRTKNKIKSITPEYPEQTQISFVGEKKKDTYVYRLRFDRLGENLLTVECLDGRSMVLEFFVTEPLEVLIKKRAAFLVEKQLIRDPSKWYDGLVGDWDMKNKVLRTPDNVEDDPSDTDTRGGFSRMDEILTSGDPMLCKAPYLAAKNAHYPSREEVEAVDYHLAHFIWGKQQLTDSEGPLPFGIYSIPNWRKNRESKKSNKPGHWEEQVSRAYDYPHFIMLYLSMYPIAKLYPTITIDLENEEYLKRAFGTARAFFTLPYKRNPMEHNLWKNKPSAQTTGMYNELVIVDLIEALYAAGMTEKAEWLKNEWEKKVEYFVNEDPYLWGSEFAFDPTAFESTHALAKYAMEQAERSDSTLEVRREDAARFMERQILANIASRGWLESSYYLLGGSGSLRYMSQMGGWSILDYALYYSCEPENHLRLGYAAFLSSWALMNTGRPETNYGYWYPGVENDGGAGSAFVVQSYDRTWFGKKQGRGAWAYGGEIDLGYGSALRTAATVVVNDPLFGLFAYGGSVAQSRGGLEVMPRDGLRQRFHVINPRTRFHMVLDRDGFAKDEPIVLDVALTRISFKMENRTGDRHPVSIWLEGLPLGTYKISLNNQAVTRLELKEQKLADIEIEVDDSGENSVLIQRTGN